MSSETITVNMSPEKLLSILNYNLKNHSDYEDGLWFAQVILVNGNWAFYVKKSSQPEHRLYRQVFESTLPSDLIVL